MPNIDQRLKIIIAFVLISLMIIIIVFIVSLGGSRKTKNQKPTPTVSPTTWSVEFPTALPKTEAEQEEAHEFAEEDKQFKEEKETFYKKNPLGKYLPYYGDHFEIDYSGKIKNGKAGYKITLYAILNKPSQFEQYKEDYLKYKIEAIEWIKSKGIDYTKLDIEWEPEDPKNINFNQETLNYPTSQTCKTCQ